MKFAISSHRVVGGTARERSCQVLSTSELAIVVETSGPEASARAKSFLEQVETALRENYPRTLREFKLTLRFVKGEVTQTNYVASLIVGTKLFVLVERGGQVWLSRQGKQAPILTSHGSASGTVKQGDTVLLASSGMASAVKVPELKKAISLLSPAKVTEALAHTLRTRDPVPVAGAVIFYVAESTARKSPRLLWWRFLKSGLRLADWWWGQRRRAFAINRRGASFTLIMTLLILLLVGSIGLGLRQRRQKQSSSELNSILTESAHKLDEGMALVDLNPLRARELLGEAKTQLESGVALDLGKDAEGQLKEQLTRVEAGLLLALRRIDVTLTPFYELDLVKQGGVGVDISLYQDVLAVLDSRNNSLYTLSISAKAARVVAGGESLRNNRFVAVHGEDIYVFEGSLKKVVYPGGYLTEVVSADTTWNEITDVAAYAGNVYLLDQGSNQIWKYVRTETGFTARQNYLLPDTLPDLHGATNMVIDGSVWVVNGGDIIRFIQGGEAVWQVRGLDEALGGRITLYADDTTKNLYLLDRDKKRVVIVDKDGTYLAQYRWSEDYVITDLVVSEVLKKILLLSGGTIYGIDLK